MPTLYYDSTSTNYATSTTCGTWGSWNDLYLTSTTYTTNDVIWQTWTDDTWTDITNATGGNYVYEWPAEPESSVERKQQEEDARRRSEQLLDETLTEVQRREMAEFRHFTVEGGQSKRRYRVRVGAGRHGNIEELDEAGEPVRRYCVAPSGAIPEADAILGQKLCIEHAEDEFLAKANVTQLRRHVA